MKYIKKMGRNKILLLITFFMMISIILGTFFIACLSIENQKLIRDSINTYFSTLSNTTSRGSVLTTLNNNLLPNLLIWVLGISVIGIPVVLLVLTFKSFIVSFSFISIIYTLGLQGIVPAIIYILPHVISLFITFILSYYSIQFSVLLWRYLFCKKDYNRSYIVRRYLQLLGISVVVIIIVILIELFLVPFILK